MSDDERTGGKQDGSGFAGRWSRLKREAKEVPEDVGGDSEAQAAVEDLPNADGRPDEEVLDELELPDPDTLKSGDNFAAFMAKAVPAHLRNRALRKLWISDPVLANLDELIDYGDDFTDAANVIENLQTSYQVGKGFVDKVAEVAKEDEANTQEPDVDDSAGEQADEAVEESAKADDEQEVEDVCVTDAGDQVAPDQATSEPRMAVRQRMRFRVAEE